MKREEFQEYMIKVLNKASGYNYGLYEWYDEIENVWEIIKKQCELQKIECADNVETDFSINYPAVMITKNVCEL
jgi:hypothetical protein